MKKWANGFKIRQFKSILRMCLKIKLTTDFLQTNITYVNNDSDSVRKALENHSRRNFWVSVHCKLTKIKMS